MSTWQTIKRSPIPTALFTAIFVYGIAVFINKVGWFGPGPPLVDVQVEAATDDQSIFFGITGRQMTSQMLEAFTASWIFTDGTTLPAAIYHQSTVVTTPEPVNVIEGARFRLTELRALVPVAALGDPMVTFRLCWAYDELPIYCESLRYSDVPHFTQSRGPQ